MPMIAKEPRTFILPLDTLVASLLLYCENYNRLTKKASLRVNIDEDSALTVIKEMVRSAIDQRLLWAVKEDHVSNVIEQLAPTLMESENNDHWDNFYVTVLDTITLAIEHIVSEFIPRDTWDCWHMRSDGWGDSVVITRGDDFRVVEYERLVNEEIISVTDNISNAIKKRQVD